MSSISTPVSSTVSWRSAAASVASSSRRPARIFAAPHGWWMNSCPERRSCPSCACGREAERPREQLPVDVGLVGLDLGDQLVDEVLMPLEHRHRPSVLRRRAPILPPTRGRAGEEFAPRRGNRASPCSDAPSQTPAAPARLAARIAARPAARRTAAQAASARAAAAPRAAPGTSPTRAGSAAPPRPSSSSAKTARASGVQAASPRRHCSANQARSSS